MNFYERLEWSNWKQLTDQEMQEVFQQVLMYFVSPLAEIQDIQMHEYVLAGIKCRTFSCRIDSEEFVLVPGNHEAILGWNQGVNGIEKTDFSFEFNSDLPHPIANWKEEYRLETLEDYSELINTHTTPLRKAAVPAMLVQKEALPVATQLIGEYNTVTGEFVGEVEKFNLYEQAIKQQLFPTLSDSGCFDWEFPTKVLQENQFYLELLPETDIFRVFSHEKQTYFELVESIKKQNYDLLTEDQWEYVVGGGTRRLFRWGNQVKNWQTEKQFKQPNMFGLIVDSSKTKIELTADPTCVKLSTLNQPVQPFLDNFPLSTYYQSEEILEANELTPEKHLIRKTILIH
ncbi:MAG: hypothetical protein ACK5NA_02450 [Enterococcus sp.]